MTLTAFSVDEIDARSRTLAADLFSRSLFTAEEIAAYQPGGSSNPHVGDERGWDTCRAMLYLFGGLREPFTPPAATSRRAIRRRSTRRTRRSP